MFHTQVELTSPDGKTTEVWWIPVPEGRAEAGEKVDRLAYPDSVNDSNTSEDQDVYVEWTITRVFTTLQEESIPQPARIATGFLGFDGNGKPIGEPVYTKEQVKQIKEAKELIAKLNGALEKALVSNNFDKVFELGGK